MQSQSIYSIEWKSHSTLADINIKCWQFSQEYNFSSIPASALNPGKRKTKPKTKNEMKEGYNFVGKTPMHSMEKDSMLPK